MKSKLKFEAENEPFSGIFDRLEALKWPQDQVILYLYKAKNTLEHFYFQETHGSYFPGNKTEDRVAFHSHSDEEDLNPWDAFSR